MFLIQYCRAAAVRLGKPSLALTLSFISISPKTQTRTVPASLPCIWHSPLQICAQPAGFAESHSANSTAAKVRYSDESRLHHDAYFTKLTAFLCGLSWRWLYQLCMMYCVRLIVHLSVQRSKRSPIFNVLCSTIWRVKEMQIRGDHCYKRKGGLGSA